MILFGVMAVVMRYTTSRVARRDAGTQTQGPPRLASGMETIWAPGAGVQ
jgi:hypothetical protein